MLKSYWWGGWVAHVIIVSAQGPNPSFFLFFGDFYSTWGPVGTRTWTKLDKMMQKVRRILSLTRVIQLHRSLRSIGRTSCVFIVTRVLPCRGTGRARTRRSTSPTSCPTSLTHSTQTSRKASECIGALTRTAAIQPARRITSSSTWLSSMTSGTKGSTGELKRRLL